MLKIRKMRAEDIGRCAEIYRSAYREEPWKEEYTEEEVCKYLSEFMNAPAMRCYVLMNDAEIVGMTLTILVPSIGAPYLRIEDFCIGADYHRQGFGSAFLELLAGQAREMGCDSILLGTQRGFPSHRFYLKNGFREIEAVLLYQNIGKE